MIMSIEQDKEAFFGKLFDANGVEIDYVVRFDSDTGEVTQLVRDDSQSHGYKLNKACDAVERITSIRPAPLTFIPRAAQ